MSRPWTPPDPDDLIERYRSGTTIIDLAREHGVSITPIRGFLRRSGVPFRGPADTQAMLRWQPPDDLATRYLAGESENALARACGVSRTVIQPALERLGVQRRGVTDANRLEQAGRTPAERHAYTAAAHRASTGRRRTPEEMRLTALTRQRLGLGISDLERQLGAWLREREVEVVEQLAIGPYNCDLVADPVAVEVFGGGWHGAGRHRARFAERTRYLLDQRWALIIVWSIAECPLSEGAADYIAALHEQARGDPALRGQYRVIWGGGEEAAVAGLDLDELARVPAHGRSHDARP